jgi:hypothetical protein
MRRIEREAREVTRDARNDRERVELVLRHFLTRFDYALETGDLEGPEAIAAFLETRRGFCTLFASASVLMLRELGISSRVAVGYSAHEWSQAEQAWLALDRDAHAWIEVHWEDLGWIAEDPTPPDRRRRAFDIFDGVLDDDSESWTARLRERLSRWIESSGRDVSLAELARILLGAPRALAEHPRGRWMAIALLLVALLTLARPRRAVRPPGAGPPPPPGSPRARFLRALARRGHPRRPSQTLRELVREARARDGFGLAGFETGLEASAVLLDAWRFGGLEPTPEDLGRVEATLDALQSGSAG